MKFTGLLMVLFAYWLTCVYQALYFPPSGIDLSDVGTPAFWLLPLVTFGLGWLGATLFLRAKQTIGPLARMFGQTMLAIVICLMLVEVFADGGVAAIGLKRIVTGWLNFIMTVVGGWLAFTPEAMEEDGPDPPSKSAPVNATEVLMGDEGGGPGPCNNNNISHASAECFFIKN